ncbi:MAG TPA: sulfite exporter TauE/SafE family protein, partial [Oligoflexia bacterium]|nr:sulfite exporter TauE/SafE family protein [Oligoflexia bacterium]
MTLLIVSLVAFLVSILTFFSGFGLGTVLTPVFAIWIPIDLAVALTAIVHFLNNLFKLVLVGRNANKQAVIRFGFPAIVAAALGAWVLVRVSNLSPITTYEMFERHYQIEPLKLTIALLIIAFTFFEIIPKLKNWTVAKKYISLGGLLSGFFGGLSGHQGALRSTFLIRMGLSKESFIATGVVIACFIDTVRLGIYWHHFSSDGISENATL